MLPTDAVDNEDISEKCELCDLMNLDDFGLWRPKQALAVYRCYGELEINIPDSAAHLPDVTDLEAWRLRKSLTAGKPRNTIDAVSPSLQGIHHDCHHYTRLYTLCGSRVGLGSRSPRR